jgi:glycosyltransferase involved in cell wall biosynthesis
MLYEQPLCTFYKDATDLGRRILMLDDWADVYHIHNEPDWMVPIVRMHTDKPIVYDCHDLESMRASAPSVDEARAFEACTAAIFPSESYREKALEIHAVAMKKKQSRVVYSMCTDEDLAHAMKYGSGLPAIDALVYEGAHFAPVQETGFVPGSKFYYEYRDYCKFAARCTLMGIPLVFYGTRPQHESEYLLAGAATHPMLPYRTMLAQIARYSWGFLGHPHSYVQWQRSMANKFFEYAAAGIPVIAWNCSESAKWIVDHNVGVIVNSYKELDEAFADKELQARCKNNMVGIRTAWTMESQIDGVIDLYRQIARPNES